MMRKIFVLLVLSAISTKAQTDKPKLIVGIIVDQMRSDYLNRYWDRFGKGGFKRLVNHGFQFKNTHYNYIPTYTGPGHASIYTGTTPRAHGIIANDWFLKTLATSTYCVQDEQAQSIGTDTKASKASPRQLLSSTIGDELKMNSTGRSKVFAIAIKDRSAVLPAGHAGDAAFWMDEKNGKFISSNYYVNNLPAWLTDFNNKNLAENYLKAGWSTLYPISSYTNSISDDNEYEGLAFGPKPIFPYSFNKYLEQKNFSIIKGTAFGNSITKDLALECIKKESLGKDADPDLLSISFSSPDIIAHTFGPRSVEVEDTYLRLDKDLEEILNALDKEVGANNYVVFLTADHGGADVPNHLKDKKIPAGYLTEKDLKPLLKQYFKTTYSDTLLLANLSNAQIFLNPNKILELKLDQAKIETALCQFLRTVPGIAEAYSSSTLMNGSFAQQDLRKLLQEGYNHKLSGNVCYVLQPAWMDHEQKGTTHGAGYNYDTHVPLIFFGKGIKPGTTYNYVTITQIAPSICELLNIAQPNACTSEPLNNYFR